MFATIARRLAKRVQVGVPPTQQPPPAATSTTSSSNAAAAESSSTNASGGGDHDDRDKYLENHTTFQSRQNCTTHQGLATTSSAASDATTASDTTTTASSTSTTVESSLETKQQQQQPCRLGSNRLACEQHEHAKQETTMTTKPATVHDTAETEHQSSNTTTTAATTTTPETRMHRGFSTYQDKNQTMEDASAAASITSRSSTTTNVEDNNEDSVNTSSTTRTIRTMGRVAAITPSFLVNNSSFEPCATASRKGFQRDGEEEDGSSEHHWLPAAAAGGGGGGASGGASGGAASTHSTIAQVGGAHCVPMSTASTDADTDTDGACSKVVASTTVTANPCVLSSSSDQGYDGRHCIDGFDDASPSSSVLPSQDESVISESQEEGFSSEESKAEAPFPFPTEGTPNSLAFNMSSKKDSSKQSERRLQIEHNRIINAVVTPSMDCPQAEGALSSSRKETQASPSLGTGTVRPDQDCRDCKSSRAHADHNGNDVRTSELPLDDDSSPSNASNQEQEQHAGESSMEHQAVQHARGITVTAGKVGSSTVTLLELQDESARAEQKRREATRDVDQASPRIQPACAFVSFPESEKAAIREGGKHAFTEPYAAAEQAHVISSHVNPLELFAEFAVTQSMQETSDSPHCNKESSVLCGGDSDMKNPAIEGRDGGVDSACCHDEPGSQLMSLLLAAKCEHMHGDSQDSDDGGIHPSKSQGDDSDLGVDVRRSKRRRAVPSKFSRDDIITDIKILHPERHDDDERVVDMSMINGEHDSHPADGSSCASSNYSSDEDTSEEKEESSATGTRKQIQPTWTAEEDFMVVDQRERCGLPFEDISEMMPGRSIAACKSRFNRLKRLKKIVRPKAKKRSVLTEEKPSRGESEARGKRQRKAPAAYAGRTRRPSRTEWTQDELDVVVDQRERCGLSFDEISQLIPGRSSAACKSQYSRLEKNRKAVGKDVPSGNSPVPPTPFGDVDTGLKRARDDDSIAPEERQTKDHLPVVEHETRNKRQRTAHIVLSTSNSVITRATTKVQREWAEYEDHLLCDKRDRCGLSFYEISKLISGRSEGACKGRYHKITRSKKKVVRPKRTNAKPPVAPSKRTIEGKTRIASSKQKVPGWSDAEDALLLEKRALGCYNWDQIATFFPGRSVGSVSGRWSRLAQSSPKETAQKAPRRELSASAAPRSKAPRKGQQEWSEAEDYFLLDKKDRCGLTWGEIASLMQGRSTSACSTRYYCHLTNPKVAMETSAPAKQTRIMGLAPGGVGVRPAGNGNDFTPEEDAILRRMKAGHLSYDKIAAHLPGRSAKECRERFEQLGVASSGVSARRAGNRNNFAPEEDAMLRRGKASHLSYENIAARLQGRSANECRERFEELGVAPGGINARPACNSNDFTPEEDAILRRRKASHLSYENIAARLPGRSAKECRERFEELSKTTKTARTASGSRSSHGVKAKKHAKTSAPAIDKKPARSFKKDAVRGPLISEEDARLIKLYKPTRFSRYQ